MHTESNRLCSCQWAQLVTKLCASAPASSWGDSFSQAHFPAAFTSFSPGELTRTSNFSKHSMQGERKYLIRKVAESAMNFYYLYVNFILSAT